VLIEPEIVQWVIGRFLDGGNDLPSEAHVSATRLPLGATSPTALRCALRNRLLHNDERSKMLFAATPDALVALSSPVRRPIS
jgi:hypothetical protein